MSRISDLTCNETMSDDAERGIVAGTNSLSRRYQAAPTQSPATFRVAPSRYTATSGGKPGYSVASTNRGGYSVANPNRPIPAGAHTIHRSYTVASQPSHLSPINPSISNVTLSTSQVQQATANRIMRTHLDAVPEPADYGLHYQNVMTHNPILRPSGSNREMQAERVVSRATYRSDRPPSIREDRLLYRQEPTVVREVAREEIPQPQIVHRAHGVVSQSHPLQQPQSQVNLYINSMRLTQPPAPQVTAKIGLGTLHTVQQMTKNTDRSTSYSPSIRAYSTTPSGMQRTITPTSVHQVINQSRFTPVNGNNVQQSVVRPVPTTPVRVISTGAVNHGLLQPPSNPMTHAIPDSPTPIVQQFMNQQRVTTTQSPRPSILRTPGSAAKRKLALVGFESSCTNGNNSAHSSAVRSLSATSITTVTRGTIPSGDPSTTPEPSPRKRQRKQQLEPTPTLLEAAIKQQQLIAAQAKAQLEAAQRSAEAEKQTHEAWRANAAQIKPEEPVKKKRGRPKSDGVARPTTAGSTGKTPAKPRMVRTAAAGSMASQRFFAEQEAKYKASQAAADDPYDIEQQEYEYSDDQATVQHNLSFEFATTSNEPQPKSAIAQKHIAQQRAAAVQQYAAQQLAAKKSLKSPATMIHTVHPSSASAGMQRPPQTATAPALAPGTTQHLKKQKGPRIKHSVYPSTSKKEVTPQEESANTRPKRGTPRKSSTRYSETHERNSKPQPEGGSSSSVATANKRKSGNTPVDAKILNYLADAVHAQMLRKSEGNGEGKATSVKKSAKRTTAQIMALRTAIMKAAEAAQLPTRDANGKTNKAKPANGMVATDRPSRKPSAPQRGSTNAPAGPIRRSISVPDGNLVKEKETNEDKEDKSTSAIEDNKKVKTSQGVLKKVKIKKKKEDDPQKEFRVEIAKPSKMRVQLPVISLKAKPQQKVIVGKTKKKTNKAKVDVGRKKSVKKCEKQLNCEGIYPAQTRWASVFLATLLRKKQQKKQVERKLEKLREKNQTDISIPLTLRRLEQAGSVQNKPKGVSIMAGMKTEESRPNHFDQPGYVRHAVSLRQQMISNLRKQQRLDRADHLRAKRSAKALLQGNEMSMSHLCDNFGTDEDGNLSANDQEVLVEAFKNILQQREHFVEAGKPVVTKSLKPTKKEIVKARKLRHGVARLRKKGIDIYTEKELLKAKEQIVHCLPSVSCAKEAASCSTELPTTSEELHTLVQSFEEEQLENVTTGKPVILSQKKTKKAMLYISASLNHSSPEPSTSTTEVEQLQESGPQQYFVMHTFNREHNLKALVSKLQTEVDEDRKKQLQAKIHRVIRTSLENKEKDEVELKEMHKLKQARQQTFDSQLKALLLSSKMDSNKLKTTSAENSHPVRKSTIDRKTTSTKESTPTIAVGNVVQKSVVRLTKDDLPVVITKKFFIEKHPRTSVDPTNNSQMTMKKRKQFVRYESNSAGVPVPRVNKVVDFRLPFPIEGDFSRVTEEQLKEEDPECVASVGFTTTGGSETTNEEKLNDAGDCKCDEVKEEPAEEKDESALHGRSATFAGTNSASEFLQPAKPVRKDKHLLILEEAMRNYSKKGEKNKSTAGQPSTFNIPMLKCVASPSTSKTQPKIKNKQDKLDKMAKEDVRPRSKSESENSKKTKDRKDKKTDKEKKKEDGKKTSSSEETRPDIASSEESLDAPDKNDLPCGKTVCFSDTVAGDSNEVDASDSKEPAAEKIVYNLSELKKIDKRKIAGQKVVERDGKLVKIIQIRKDQNPAPVRAMPLSVKEAKLLSQCKKVAVRQFLQPCLQPLSQQEQTVAVDVQQLLSEMVHFVSVNTDLAEENEESSSLNKALYMLHSNNVVNIEHPMSLIAPTFRSVIEEMKPAEICSVELSSNQYSVGDDMKQEMWWKVAAKKLPSQQEKSTETIPQSQFNSIDCNTVRTKEEEIPAEDILLPKTAQRTSVRLVRPSKMSRAVALLQQYSSRVEDQMTLEKTTLLAFETFLQQFDQKAYHDLQLNLLRDYEDGDTVEILEEKKMLRLRHTILLPPIEFLPNKKPEYGDACKSVVLNPTEDFQNQIMKGCSTFWRGKMQDNPNAMHLNRYGHQVVDRCEGFVPLQSDHREFYLEDVQDYVDEKKFENYYGMFEKSLERESICYSEVHEIDENKTSVQLSSYNGVSRRAVLKQGSTEILFMGEKPLNGMVSTIAPSATEVNSKMQSRVRNVREIFATSFKAMHETSLIMIQTREMMVRALATRYNQEARRRLKLARLHARQPRVKTKNPKSNVVVLLKKLRRHFHRRKSGALKMPKNTETSPNNKEKPSQTVPKAQSIAQRQKMQSRRIGAMPPFRPPKEPVAPVPSAVKRKQTNVFGSPKKKQAVEQNGKPVPKVVIANNEKINLVAKVEPPKTAVNPHHGTVNRGGRPPLRRPGLSRGGSTLDRKIETVEVAKAPVVPSIRGAVMGRGLGRSGPITRVARGGGLTRGAQRSVSSSTTSSNNDVVVTTPVTVTEPVEKGPVVRKPHKPRVPKTPVMASDSTFERQMRRAIQESLRDVPSASKPSK